MILLWNMGGRLLILKIMAVFAVCSGGRLQKRVVWGEIIPEQARSTVPYSAVKYYVWIGFGRDFFWDVVTFARVWRFERQVCSGALLTSKIIQSACHCYTDHQYPDRDGFQRAVRNGGEMEVVVGHSEADKEIPPKPIKYYVIHPCCGQVKGRWLINDFALLILDDDDAVTPSAGLTLAPAPVYPLEDLIKTWRRFTMNGNVCLILGFGQYNSLTDLRKSWALRHGWQALMRYHDCYESYQAYGNTYDIKEFKNIMTTSCYKHFEEHKLLTAAGKGDSGSPVTCDNMYFGLISQTSPDESWGTIMDVIFYAFANSAEYRNTLIEKMASHPFGRYTISAKHRLKPENLFTPKTPPPNFFSATRNAAAYLRINVNLVIRALFAEFFIFTELYVG